MNHDVFDLSVFAQEKLREAQEAGLAVFLVDFFMCIEHKTIRWVWAQPEIHTYHKFEVSIQDGRTKLQTHLCANKDKAEDGELKEPDARRARDILVSVFGPSTAKVAAA